MFNIRDERQKYDEMEVSDMEEEEDSEYGDEAESLVDNIVSSSPPETNQVLSDEEVKSPDESQDQPLPQKMSEQVRTP